MKLCECGCGQPAPLASESRRRRGFARGEAQRFVRGHAMRGRGRPVLERIAERQEWRDFGYLTRCLVQTSGLLKTGYGQVYEGGRVRRTHVVVWEKANGPVPRGFEVHHLCHDPATCAGGPSCPHRACHNRGHLALATHLDNVRAGGRHP